MIKLKTFNKKYKLKIKSQNYEIERKIMRQKVKFSL